MNMLLRELTGTPTEIIEGVNLVQEDLVEAYLAVGDIERAREAGDIRRRPELEDAQARRYETGQGYRYGVVDTEVGSLVGMAMVNDWYRGDQYPFASPLGRAGLKALKALNTPLIPGRPVGIHTLVVDRGLDEQDQFETAMLLGVGALNYAEDREIRISLPERDPSEEALRQLGFIATGRWGERIGVPGLPQQLFVRKRL